MGFNGRNPDPHQLGIAIVPVWSAAAASSSNSFFSLLLLFIFPCTQDVDEWKKHLASPEASVSKQATLFCWMRVISIPSLSFTTFRQKEIYRKEVLLLLLQERGKREREREKGGRLWPVILSGQTSARLQSMETYLFTFCFYLYTYKSCILYKSSPTRIAKAVKSRR